MRVEVQGKQFELAELHAVLFEQMDQVLDLVLTDRFDLLVGLVGFEEDLGGLLRLDLSLDVMRDGNDESCCESKLEIHTSPYEG